MKREEKENFIFTARHEAVATLIRDLIKFWLSLRKYEDVKISLVENFHFPFDDNNGKLCSYRNYLDERRGWAALCLSKRLSENHVAIALARKSNRELINILSTWRKSGCVMWQRFPALAHNKFRAHKRKKTRKLRKSIWRRPDGKKALKIYGSFLGWNFVGVFLRCGKCYYDKMFHLAWNSPLSRYHVGIFAQSEKKIFFFLCFRCFNFNETDGEALLVNKPRIFLENSKEIFCLAVVVTEDFCAFYKRLQALLIILAFS